MFALQTVAFLGGASLDFNKNTVSPSFYTRNIDNADKNSKLIAAA